MAIYDPKGRLLQAQHRSAHVLQGFTLLELLIAMSILSIALVALHQGFASIIQVRQTSGSLWQAIHFGNAELLRLERDPNPPAPSVAQGVYDEQHPLAGYSWTRTVRDESPLPGVTIREVILDLRWKEAGNIRSYRARMYVPPR